MHSSASDNQSGLCLESYESVGTNAICCELTYKSGVLERCKGSIRLVPQRNPDLQGSGGITNLRSISERSEQNSSKLRHTMRLLTGRLASLKGSLRDVFVGRSAARGYRILGCLFSEPSLFEQCVYASGVFFLIVALGHCFQTSRKSHASGVLICGAVFYIIAIIIIIHRLTIM